MAALTAAIWALRKAVEAQTAEIGELRSALAARDLRVAELEKLLEESRRSGKRQAAPFSKGDPSDEPKAPGRKRGRDHGRHAHRMAPARIDRELLATLPQCCPHCGGDVGHERDVEQFQTDLPALASPTVTRFKVGVGRCSSCGKRMQGRHPRQTSDALGAAGSQIGPMAKCWVPWLHYGLGLSFVKCSQLLGRLGVPVTAGAICSASQSMGTALVPVTQNIIERVNASPVVTMDETGWRVDGLSSWLWLAAIDEATAYNVASGRGFDHACDLVADDYNGVIIRDGWGPYRRHERAAHQSCVAHLLRRASEMAVDLPDWARGTPRQVKDLLGDALDAREADPAERAAIAAHVVEMIELLADQAHPHDENRKLIKHLYREREAIVTFLTHPGVEATNWRGEQAIRPAVVNRKVWGGNRTWRGAATQGIVMSVLRTATQQGVDVIDYLAHHARSPDPACGSRFS
jgi:transposase